MSQRHYSVLGAEFNLPKAYIPKKKHATAISEHRQMAVADALGAERREAIKAEAKEAAAEAMRKFNERTGR